jgi:hypothetical protein
MAGVPDRASYCVFPAPASESIEQTINTRFDPRIAHLNSKMYSMSNVEHEGLLLRSPAPEIAINQSICAATVIGHQLSKFRNVLRAANRDS